MLIIAIVSSACYGAWNEASWIGCIFGLFMTIAGIILNEMEKTSDDYSPPSPPPQPQKPPQQPKQPAPDTTVLKVDPPGNIFKAAGIIAGSYVDYEIDYDIYQKQLDDFLKHGVIPGVEATTESCKKTWGMMYELFVGRSLEEDGYNVQYNGIENGIKDCGIDIVAEKNLSEVIIVQCKYWRDTLIDSDVISRMCGARELFYYRYCRGDIDVDLHCTIVTSSKLTAYAKKFAENQAINIVENVTMDQYSIPWVKGLREKFYLPWDSNYTKVPKEKYFVSVVDAVYDGCKIRGDESGVIEDHESLFSLFNIHNFDFDVMCERLCANVESALRKNTLFIVDTLGDFSADLNIDAFEALHEYLQENSLDDLDCGNLWIDYLTAECIKSLDSISNKEFAFFLKVCEQDHPEYLPEDLLLEKFLKYCQTYEKNNLKID